MRFFPQETRSNILNSVEMATLFHLPGANAIPTSQVKRQMSKQVDGPTDVLDEGLLIGYNEFRGVKNLFESGQKTVAATYILLVKQALVNPSCRKIWLIRI